MKTSEIEYKPVGECPYCGKMVIGRSNKKFCSPQCKSNFHNRTRNAAVIAKFKYLDDLNKNYLILKKLLSVRKNSIDIKKIQEMGFNPNSCTCFSFKPGSSLRCQIYNIEFRRTGKKIFSIKLIS